MKFFGKNNILSVSLDLQTLPGEINNAKTSIQDYQNQLDLQEQKLLILQESSTISQNKIIDIDSRLSVLVAQLTANTETFTIDEFTDVSQQILQLKTEKQEHNTKMTENDHEMERIRTMETDLIRKQNDSKQELIRLEDKLQRKKKQLSEMKR